MDLIYLIRRIRSFVRFDCGWIGCIATDTAVLCLDAPPVTPPFPFLRINGFWRIYAFLRVHEHSVSVSPLSPAFVGLCVVPRSFVLWIFCCIYPHFSRSGFH